MAGEDFENGIFVASDIGLLKAAHSEALKVLHPQK